MLKPRNNRPGQDLEWIGDAAIVVGLRILLLKKFPNVSYRTISQSINFLSTNNNLGLFGKRQRIGGPREVEQLFGELFSSKVALQVNLESLLECFPKLINLLGLLNQAQNWQEKVNWEREVFELTNKRFNKKHDENVYFDSDSPTHK